MGPHLPTVKLSMKSMADSATNRSTCESRIDWHHTQHTCLPETGDCAMPTRQPRRWIVDFKPADRPDNETDGGSDGCLPEVTGAPHLKCCALCSELLRWVGQLVRRGLRQFLHFLIVLLGGIRCLIRSPAASELSLLLPTGT